MALPRRSSALVVVLALVLAGCASGGDGDADPFAEGTRFEAEQAVGLAVTEEGNLLVGERLTGRITTLDPTSGRPLSDRTVDGLDTDLAQGGLLGLAVTDGDDVVASYVDGDGRLVVRTVDEDGAGEDVWTGPEAQDEANGGRLAVLDDGRLVIGIGDLLDPDAVEDPDAPNGKVLVIDDDGEVAPLAGGFNNPFALTAEGDTVWVADNAPGRTDERLLRVVDGEVEEVASWTDTRVPSGIAVLEDGRVALCNYATSELRLVDPDDAGDATGELLADDCRYGVVALPDGGLAYAAEDAVVLLGPA